jgi:cathepsin B
LLQYVYSDFRHYHSGVYEKTKGAKYLGAHAVRIIGWGIEEDADKTPYWLVGHFKRINANFNAYD